MMDFYPIGFKPAPARKRARLSKADLLRIARSLRRNLSRAYRELLCQGYEPRGPELTRMRKALQRTKGKL